MADYPGAFWPGNTRGGLLSDADVHTKWHDDIAAEVQAMQAEGGLTPSGPFADVKTRFEALGPTVLNNTPGVNIDSTTTGLMVNWLDFGAYTVAAGAIEAVVTIHLNNFLLVTGNSVFALCAQINGVGGTPDAAAWEGLTSDTGNVSFSQSILAPTTGNLRVMARRVTGTGALRARSTMKNSATVTIKG